LHGNHIVGVWEVVELAPIGKVAETIAAHASPVSTSKEFIDTEREKMIAEEGFDRTHPDVGAEPGSLATCYAWTKGAPESSLLHGFQDIINKAWSFNSSPELRKALLSMLPELRAFEERLKAAEEKLGKGD
jgi:hypothetical protein